MSFNLSNHEEWLSQQPMSGVSNGPDDPVTITASVDSSELASGQYVDVINIDVTSSGKSPGQVIVILDVLPPDYIRQFVSRDEGGIVVLPDGTVKLSRAAIVAAQRRGHRVDEGQLAGTRSAAGRAGAGGRCDRVEHVRAWWGHA